MIHRKYLNLFLLISFFNISVSYSCRYTVREIGFSDIGSAPYILYVYTKSDIPEDNISTIRKLSYALLNESNVKLEIINLDEKEPSPALNYLQSYEITSFPSAVLVSPGGESMICPFISPGQSFNESAWLLLESLVSSQVQNEIIKHLVQSFCVVLIIEGSNTLKNKKTKHEVNEAFKEIKIMLKQMPKIVNDPPSLCIIPYKNIRDEHILLMSLGINKKEFNDPHVAIIYGRGRIMGPVLTGTQITKRRIFNLLTIVGADCECGIDHSWILGRMIPLRWEPSVQSKLAKYLGFDVENPMVKSEMSQIISLKPITENPINPIEDNLLGYTEGKFEIQKRSDDIPRISATEIRESFSQTSHLINNQALKIILFSLSGIFLIILFAGIFIFVKYKRKREKNE